MNLPSRYWAPDENAETAPDLTHEQRLWCVRRIEPNWCLYWPTVDAAFSALQYRPEMDRLIAEIDEDTAELARLDCSDLGEWLEEIARVPALLRRQAN